MRNAIFRGMFILMLCVPVTANANETPKVIVSIKPIHSLVTALMRGVAIPKLIVEGRTTPYKFKISAAQQEKLKKADLIVWIGPELEKFLVHPLNELGPKSRLVELLSNRDLKILPARNQTDQRDPFLWLDVRNAELLVDILFEAIVATDPSRLAQYEKNRSSLKQQIAHLDREFEYNFRSVAAGVGSAYHDTQQYFQQSYGLKLLGFVSKSPDQPADTARLLSALTSLNGQKTRCFFIEKGLQEDNLPILSRYANINISTLDSFATDFSPGPKLYEKMMRFNFNAIAGCFKKTGAKYKTGKKQ
jgi:protein SCO1/2